MSCANCATDTQKHNVSDRTLSNEEQLDGIIGYFFKPFEKEISNDVAQKIKSELEAAIKEKFRINFRIDLWN